MRRLFEPWPVGGESQNIRKDRCTHKFTDLDHVDHAEGEERCVQLLHLFVVKPERMYDKASQSDGLRARSVSVRYGRSPGYSPRLTPHLRSST